MKLVILAKNPDVEIIESAVSSKTPIIAYKGGKPMGMFLYEPSGWILRFPLGGGCSGHHNTREQAIESAQELGYEPFVD